jgi:cell division protein FtsB
MAKNRKNQAAAIRFGPALKASFLCLLIGGSAVGYVWQKNEIYRLGQQIRQREAKLAQLQSDNKRFSDQISILHSPVMLDQRAKELNLGLAPATPMQVVRLTETPVVPEKNNLRQFAQRPVADLTP